MNQPTIVHIPQPEHTPDPHGVSGSGLIVGLAMCAIALIVIGLLVIKPAYTGWAHDRRAEAARAEASRIAAQGAADAMRIEAQGERSLARADADATRLSASMPWLAAFVVVLIIALVAIAAIGRTSRHPTPTTAQHHTQILVLPPSIARELLANPDPAQAWLHLQEQLPDLTRRNRD